MGEQTKHELDMAEREVIWCKVFMARIDAGKSVAEADQDARAAVEAYVNARTDWFVGAE